MPSIQERDWPDRFRESPLNFAFNEGVKDGGRRVLKTIFVTMWVTGSNAVLDSGAVLHVLCKGFIDLLCTKLHNKKQQITAVTGEKSPAVVMPKHVPIHPIERVVKRTIMEVIGLFYDVYDVIVGRSYDVKHVRRSWCWKSYSISHSKWGQDINPDRTRLCAGIPVSIGRDQHRRHHIRNIVQLVLGWAGKGFKYVRGGAYHSLSLLKIGREKTPSVIEKVASLVRGTRSSRAPQTRSGEQNA